MSDRRIVYIHADGIHQICGVVESGVNLPVTLGPFTTRGQEIEFASLVKVHPSGRAAYYKPAAIQPAQTFNEAQR